MLAQVNRDPRDDHILFEEKGHIYTFLPTKESFLSVTTLIHSYFPKFDEDEVIKRMMRSRNWAKSKYNGMTAEEIKAEWKETRETAAALGTCLHKQIEDFLNRRLKKLPDTREFKMFLDFWFKFSQANPRYQPYRTEWIIYDEQVKVAGTIDFVLADEKGNLVLLDWKRSKEIKRGNPYQKGFPPIAHLDDCNFNHYSLQLNIYRHILEERYKRNILAMFIVVFHPDQEDYQFIHIKRNEVDVRNIWVDLQGKLG